MKRSFGPTTSGMGAVYAWDGNSEVGQGQMQITESVPPSRITIKLDFVRPLEAHNTVEFALEPRGRQTNVQWSMHGDTPFLGKIMHVFIDMDDMVGKDFESGLANLKAIAEE
jgi:hypothetical protein